MKVGDLILLNQEKEVPLWDYLGQDHPKGVEQQGTVKKNELCLILEVSDLHETTQREIKIFGPHGLGWSRDVYFICVSET